MKLRVYLTGRSVDGNINLAELEVYRLRETRINVEQQEVHSILISCPNKISFREDFNLNEQK